MTSRDRASLAQLLGEVCDRLEQAPGRASDAARSTLGVDVLNSEHGSYAESVFRATTLEHACKDSATMIRHFVSEYLSPKKARGKR